MDASDVAGADELVGVVVAGDDVLVGVDVVPAVVVVVVTVEVDGSAASSLEQAAHRTIATTVAGSARRVMPQPSRTTIPREVPEPTELPPIEPGRARRPAHPRRRPQR